MSRPTIFELTQTILALVIIIGGGWLLVSNAPDAELITGLMGAVVGFYFGRQIGETNGYNLAKAKYAQEMQGHAEAVQAMREVEELNRANKEAEERLSELTNAFEKHVGDLKD